MTSVTVSHLGKDFHTRKGLRRTTLRAVDDVSFELLPGRTVALVGSPVPVSRRSPGCSRSSRAPRAARSTSGSRTAPPSSAASTADTCRWSSRTRSRRSTPSTRSSTTSHARCSSTTVPAAPRRPRSASANSSAV